MKGSQVVACPEERHGVLPDTLLLFLENTIPARVLVLPNSFLGKSCWQAFREHSAASRGSCRAFQRNIASRCSRAFELNQY